MQLVVSRMGPLKESNLLLLPPGVAVVAHQVIVLLERGIVVSRQHLTVGVDVDTGILALLEQLFQVLEVVSGDQDAGASADADVHLGQLGLAVSRGVRLVEQGHDGDGGLACLHHHLDHLVLGEVFGVDASASSKSCRCRILVAEHGRVICIAAMPFAVDE